MRTAVLLTLLFVAGPAQAQLAHFCSAMEQSAVGTCCCAHDEQPVTPTHEACPDDVGEPCCRAVIDLVVDEAAAILPPGRLGVSAHDPPTLAPPFAADLAPALPLPALPAPLPAARLYGTGTRTYLRTLRLRL